MPVNKAPVPSPPQTRSVKSRRQRQEPRGTQHDRACRAGRIARPGATIIEPTSGNTGIGLAWIAAIRGYKLILTMPDTMSAERRSSSSPMARQSTSHPGQARHERAIERARELREKIPGSVILDQFANPTNPAAHFATTAHEIWRAHRARSTFLLAGVGTGGTISGIGRYLKSKTGCGDQWLWSLRRKRCAVGVATPGLTAFRESAPDLYPRHTMVPWSTHGDARQGSQAVLAARALARTEGILTGFFGWCGFVCRHRACPT